MGACSASVSRMVRISANRHFFIEQILQHFMQCGKRDDARNKISPSAFAHLLGDAIQQLLRLLTTKQLCGMLANEVVKMRCHHRAGLNHGVPLNLRLLFKRTFNPDSIQAKCRIDQVASPGNVPAAVPGLIANQRPG